MSDEVKEQVAISVRLKFGVAVFAVSILLPVVGVPVVTSLTLSAEAAAAVIAVLLVSAELLGLVAVATMGKPGYRYVRDSALRFLKKHGPPDHVGPVRYRIGLVMFILPLLFAWLYPYATTLIESLPRAPLAVAVIGDLILLVSLFVLGGDFWDKVRALFIREATARLPADVAEGDAE